jgi:4-amino-4-deoxy-L-arabinose transferase-like glycosyltransferase
MEKNTILRWIFRQNLGLYICMFVAFFTRLYMAWVNPFLQPWDEKFHALVARNFVNDPLLPLLRARPVTDHFDPNLWCCNHIWLHKQPLFMWIMAASIKVLGSTPLAVRVPSILMSLIMTWLIFKITLLVSRENKNIALLASTLFALSSFHIELVAGMRSLDHNDICHQFFILTSIYAYLKYIQTENKYWVILIGFAAGCAVMVKWLTGLLIFFGWLVDIVINWKKNTTHSIAIIDYSIALGIAIMIFIPWQIYIFANFPDQAKYEFVFNTRHITSVIEGHTGDYFHYLAHFPKLFGMYIFPLMLVVLYWLIKNGKSTFYAVLRKNLDRKYTIPIVTNITVVFVFFSFIAKTKMVNYFFIVVPLCLIFIAMALSHLMDNIPNKYLRYLLYGIVLWTVINPTRFFNYLSASNTERQARIVNTKIYQSIDRLLPKDTKVVMNACEFEDIDIMFYHNDLTAYSWCLSEDEFKILKSKKIPIAVFQDHGKYKLPDYVKTYPYLTIIPQILNN